MVERRAAERYPTEPIAATVNGVPVVVVELSRIGARIQHTARFPLEKPRLNIRRPEGTLDVAIRVIRSEIVGRKDGQLLYQTGVQIDAAEGAGEGILASILREAQAKDAVAAAPPPPPAPVQPAPSKAKPPSLDDTWTRQVRFLRDDSDDHLPYAQFRMTGTGWVKEYVGTPDQPEDGFTLRRDDQSFADMQKTFEVADDETRRMMRVALRTRLTYDSSS